VPVHINQTVYPQEFALHKKYAQSERLLDLVWTHCNIVTDIVIQLYQRTPDKFDFPIEVAMQGALTHDIGVYMCGGFEWLPGQPAMQMPYSQHTVVGAWILYQEGYLPEVVQIANCHAGVGLTPEDIQNHQLQIPLDSYEPKTAMQQLVTFAAKYHSKTPRFKNTDEIRKTLQQFGKEKLEIFNQLVNYFGEPDLEEIMPKYVEWHKAFSYEMTQMTAPGSAGFSSAGISKLQ
jgi:uncharacterized protein